MCGLKLSILSVQEQSEFRLMTVQQIIKGSRYDALIRVARFAKENAQVLPVSYMHANNVL